ncbi:hypothetical protein F5X99DRAFT_340626 [Biscogniauxia marginata]|nr:hypothetical protein F5X99DRAFT_340626 [Biscogniauxia marginata]
MGAHRYSAALMAFQPPGIAYPAKRGLSPVSPAVGLLGYLATSRLGHRIVYSSRRPAIVPSDLVINSSVVKSQAHDSCVCNIIGRYAYFLFAQRAIDLRPSFSAKETNGSQLARVYTGMFEDPSDSCVRPAQCLLLHTPYSIGMHRAARAAKTNHAWASVLPKLTWTAYIATHCRGIHLLPHAFSRLSCSQPYLTECHPWSAVGASSWPW